MGELKNVRDDHMKRAWTPRHPICGTLSPSCKPPTQSMQDWREVPGHPKYLVSRYGDFWNTKLAQPLYMGNLSIYKGTSRKMPIVSLDGTQYTAYKLFVEVWVPNPESKKYAIPIDRDYSNMTIDNWYWSNRKLTIGMTLDEFRHEFDILCFHQSTDLEKLRSLTKLRDEDIARFHQCIINMIEHGIDPSGDEISSGLVPMKFQHKKVVYVSDTLLINQYGIVYDSESRSVQLGYKDKQGYLNISVTLEGRQINKRLHICVAETFIPTEANRPYVNHINNIRIDPCLWNLEWVSPKENIHHAMKIKALHPKCAVPDHIIHKICEMLCEGDKTVPTIAKLLGLSWGFVDRISRGYSRLDISSRYDWISIKSDSHGKLLGADLTKTEIVRQRKQQYLAMVDPDNPYKT